MKAETISTHRGGMWSWLFQRITAVLLIVCLAIHLILTHIVNIGELDYRRTSARGSRTRGSPPSTSSCWRRPSSTR